MTQGRFAAPTSTGAQTVNTGVNYQLRAIRFYGSLQTAVGYATEQSNWMGIAADSSGTINQQGLAWAYDYNLATSNAGQWSADSVIVILSDGTPTLDGIAVLDSFGHGENVGKFYLNWPNAPASAALVYYEAYYGDALANVNVTQHTVTSAAGTRISFTGIGFQPQFIFTMASSQTAKGSRAHATPGFGWATGASQQGAITICAIDADAALPVNNRTRQNTNLCMACFRTGAQSADNSLQHLSFDADGFTDSVITRTTANVIFWVLSMRGGRYAVGFFDSPTSGGTPQDRTLITLDITGQTFVPSGVSFMSGWSTTLNSNIAQAQLTFGAGKDSSGTIKEQFAATIDSQNINTQAGMGNSLTKSIQMAIHNGTGPPSVSVEADYKTQTSNGFTVTWTTITTTGHRVFYWALGSNPVVSTAGNIRRQRLLRSEKLEEENAKVTPAFMGYARCKLVQ
jgi:hypothetical protein